MTKEFVATLGLSIGLFALVSVLPMGALAQANHAGARPSATDAGVGKAPKAGGAVTAGASDPDMRLWSFGECDTNFPYVETPEHKECVRVVGSNDAKDARAVHFCEVSHAKDPAEATRCVDTYLANVNEAEREGFRGRSANPPPVVAPAAPPPKRDKAAEIASLTRALTAPDPEEPAPAAAPAPEPAPAPAPPPPASFSGGNIMLGLAIILLLAGTGMHYLRKVTAGEAAAKVISTRRGSPKAVVRKPSKQY